MTGLALVGVAIFVALFVAFAREWRRRPGFQRSPWVVPLTIVAVLLPILGLAIGLLVARRYPVENATAGDQRPSAPPTTAPAKVCLDCGFSSIGPDDTACRSCGSSRLGPVSARRPGTGS